MLKDKNGNSITLNGKGILIESKKAVKLKAQRDLKADAANAEIKASIGAKVKGSSKAEISSSGSLTVKGSIVMIN